MIISTPGTIALALVALTLLATLVAQLRQFDGKGETLDMLGIVPRWKFFLGKRSRFDVGIDWRGREENGDPGEWRAIWSARPRGRWAWLWRPEAFADGIAWLAIHTLAHRVADGKPACPESSAAYAAILDLCRRNGAAGEGQFALIQIAPDGARSMRFSSTFHIC